MKTYSLSAPTLLEPFWFNRIRHGQHPAVVSEDSTVSVDGVSLLFRGDSPPAGTAVQVRMSAGHFVCNTLADIELAKEAFRVQKAKEDEKRKACLNELRDDAVAFNAALELPFRWDVGIKDVLSGLSGGSWGDGRNKATVEHVYLLEPFEAGRLKRKKGDFLCTSANGSNGKRWSNKIVERSHDGDGISYQPKVTCKACIALANKKKEKKNEFQNNH